jgi:hypothetical protein
MKVENKENEVTIATNASVAGQKDARGIDQEVVNLAAAITADMQVDKETGIATVGTDLYERLLPEGLSIEVVKNLKAHDTKVLTATALALGEAAVPVMKKNRDLQQATLVMPTAGKDSFGATFIREKQVTVPGKEGQPATTSQVFGQVRVEATNYATGSRGELAKVKNVLRDLAWDTFNKK